MNLTKIVKIESQEDYESTVPSTVRLANEEKVHKFLFHSYHVADGLSWCTEENARGGHPAPGTFYRDVHADEVKVGGCCSMYWVPLRHVLNYRWIATPVVLAASTERRGAAYSSIHRYVVCALGGHPAHQVAAARTVLILEGVELSCFVVPSTGTPFSESPELESTRVAGTMIDRDESSPELPTTR